MMENEKERNFVLSDKVVCCDNVGYDKWGITIKT